MKTGIDKAKSGLWKVVCLNPLTRLHFMRLALPGAYIILVKFD